MQKLLLTAALVGSLALGASAQAKKTPVKTKTTTSNNNSTTPVTSTSSTTTTTTINQTGQDANSGAMQQNTSNASGGFFDRLQSSSDGIKAAGGDITLEANVNLFGGTQVSLSNNLNQVRLRYFLADDLAARLGANLALNTDNPTTNTKTRTIEFSIAPGIEKHFAGTNRLSPYVGAEAVLGYKNSHSETTGAGGSLTEVKGSFSGGDNGNRGYFLVGVGALGGFDFYVARHLYVGYEINVDLAFRNMSTIETTTSGGGAPTVTVENAKSSGTITFGPAVRNGIRIGFVF